MHTCAKKCSPSDLHYQRVMICAKNGARSLCKPLGHRHRWPLTSVLERGHVNEPGTMWWGVPIMQTTFPTMQLSHCLVSPAVLSLLHCSLELGLFRACSRARNVPSWCICSNSGVLLTQVDCHLWYLPIIWPLAHHNVCHEPETAFRINSCGQIHRLLTRTWHRINSPEWSKTESPCFLEKQVLNLLISTSDINTSEVTETVWTQVKTLILFAFKTCKVTKKYDRHIKITGYLYSTLSLEWFTFLPVFFFLIYQNFDCIDLFGVILIKSQLSSQHVHLKMGVLRCFQHKCVWKKSRCILRFKRKNVLYLSHQHSQWSHMSNRTISLLLAQTYFFFPTLPVSMQHNYS